MKGASLIVLTKREESILFGGCGLTVAFTALLGLLGVGIGWFQLGFLSGLGLGLIFSVSSFVTGSSITIWVLNWKGKRSE